MIRSGAQWLDENGTGSSIIIIRAGALAMDREQSSTVNIASRMTLLFRSADGAEQEMII